jgi:hypothetical protein
MANSNEQLPSHALSSPNILSASTIGTLRTWLQAQRNCSLGGRELREEDVRRAMRLVCDDVRSRKLRVEQLIILLKEQWQSLGEPGDYGSIRARSALDEIIYTCIDEYYAATSPSRATEGEA